MSIIEDLRLRRIINARGTFTPLGVSRSSPGVAEEAAAALRRYFDMAELHDTAGREIAEAYRCEAAAVTHCAAAAITLSAAALMTGSDPDAIARLPDTFGMSNRIVLQAGHLVDYGQPIEQAVRLAGAEVVVAGSPERCRGSDLENALKPDTVAGLMLVDSRLCRGNMVAPEAAVRMARNLGRAVVVDAAAQDLRIGEVLDYGADLAIFSAQKYLAAPTAGLVLGSARAVAALRAQERGIGRGMKATKEAITGTLAAVRERGRLDLDAWAAARKREAEDFAAALNEIDGLDAMPVADPTNGPFRRVDVFFDEARSGIGAGEAARRLRQGDPAIHVFDAKAGDGLLNFELLALTPDEIAEIEARVRRLFD